jgi:hypothetical protein
MVGGMGLWLRIMLVVEREKKEGTRMMFSVVLGGVWRELGKRGCFSEE